MSHAIRFHSFGGPDVLKWEEIDVPAPGAGEARIRHHAVGLNFIDVYHRTGLYPMPLPSGLGLEGAGVVEAVGTGVTKIAVGDRVAYASPPIGAYADARNMPAHRLVKLPPNISFEEGAGMMLQGMTVQYLIKRTYAVRAGDTVLWHAAAGGVGLIACQWLSALGVTVIGTVGSDEKAALARQHGCHHVVNYRTEDFVAKVKEVTNGAGVPVVYDSVGRDTFERSLDCLRPFGLMVSFGNASGAVPPIDLAKASRGTLYLTRPSLNPYIARDEALETTAGDLIAAVSSGMVKIDVRQRYPLRNAADAQRDLEARRTTGSTVLLP
jgi:NADPH2:quinone reductase